MVLCSSFALSSALPWPSGLQSTVRGWKAEAFVLPAQALLPEFGLPGLKTPPSSGPGACGDAQRCWRGHGTLQGCWGSSSASRTGEAQTPQGFRHALVCVRISPNVFIQNSASLAKVYDLLQILLLCLSSEASRCLDN